MIFLGGNILEDPPIGIGIPSVKKGNLALDYDWSGACWDKLTIKGFCWAEIEYITDWSSFILGSVEGF